MIDLSPEAWQAIGGSAGAALAAVAAVAVAHISTSRKVEEAKTAVEEVRVLAEPTGNGFASKTLDALARIESRQLLADQRAERIAAELAAYREAHAREHAAEQAPGV